MRELDLKQGRAQTIIEIQSKKKQLSEQHEHHAQRHVDRRVEARSEQSGARV